MSMRQIGIIEGVGEVWNNYLKLTSPSQNSGHL